MAAGGPSFLSVQHPGAARELIGRGFEQAVPCAKGHTAAFVFADLEQLYSGVSQTYRLSMSLPTLPLERFQQETAGLGETEAETLTRIRIGQDIFRDALMDYWNGACPLTGITDRELLRASHITPWAKCSSDAQRLDVHNGLLLSSLWDAAFDAGLVTFDDGGKAVASPMLSDTAAERLSLSSAPELSLTPAHRENLAWHRLCRWKTD
ncbi:putative restriction endonuclease [Rhizobium tibeticum]|uniref:HNH endonuclease n=1 Tax=Rhizobium tibeticum TaxID=501024 RepID=UPI0027864E57|nr:HNH endonuclease [Rhizobium tibeticum]MDP9809901.1 putative restriction endonuclease [Rhizobium tibeticum]